MSYPRGWKKWEANRDNNPNPTDKNKFLSGGNNSRVGDVEEAGRPPHL
jgi:hypothetical protein